MLRGRRSLRCASLRKIGLYNVERGEAALVMTSASGKEGMCHHAGAGSLLGLPAFIGNEPAPATDTNLRYKCSTTRITTPKESA